MHLLNANGIWFDTLQTRLNQTRDVDPPNQYLDSFEREKKCFTMINCVINEYSELENVFDELLAADDENNANNSWAMLPSND